MLPRTWEVRTGAAEDLTGAAGVGGTWAAAVVSPESRSRLRRSGRTSLSELSAFGMFVVSELEILSFWSVKHVRLGFQ